MVFKTEMTNLLDCLSLPILILNNNFEDIFQHNYDSNIKKCFYFTKLIEYLRTLKFTPGKIDYTITGNISYSIVMFYYEESPMYFVLGPYTSIDSVGNNSIPTINKTYLDKIIDLHVHIINEKVQLANMKNYDSPCINRAIEYIHENYSNNFSIEDIANTLNINKCYFCSTFKKETGCTFINYLNNYKIEKSKELLKDPKLSLLDISVAVGFNNQSYYSTVFKKITGQTPLEYRECLLKELYY